MPGVGSEPSDKEVLKNSPFSKGEWPFETFIDVGFDGVYEVFGTPANADLRSVTSKHLLALTYAPGQHDELMIAMDPESFIQRTTAARHLWRAKPMRVMDPGCAGKEDHPVPFRGTRVPYLGHP